MKKLFVLAAATLMFAACGNSNNQNSTEEPAVQETVAATATDSTKSCCGDSTCTCGADSTATHACCDSTKKAE